LAAGDTSAGLKVTVSEDHLKVWVELGCAAAPGAPAPTAAQLLAALKGAHVAINEAVQKRVEELVAACSGAGPRPGKFLVAEGRAPQEAQDGTFEWALELRSKTAQSGDGDKVDYFAVSAIVTVAADTLLGRTLPPKDGQTGVDVHGRELLPRKAKGTPLKAGPGVKFVAGDAEQVVAVRDGRVMLPPGQIRVEEVLALPHDVDFGSGSVEACVDVLVQGTIRANFRVHTTKSLTVKRAIEAADVTAGGDITVLGGIFGQEGAGTVRAGGSVSALLLNEVDLRASGDVRFQKEALNSRLHAGGRLLGQTGTLIGGQAYAREGIEVRVLGSEAGVATSVATGVDVNILRRTHPMEVEIKELRKSAEQIRQAVQPLMANLKRLLPAQRERATELLCKADDLDARVYDLRKEAERLVQQGTPQGTPHVVVADALHPGVTVGIGTRETRIQRFVPGPVKIEMRKIADVTEMVAVNQRTASVTVLPSTEVDLDAPPTDEPKGAKHESRAAARDRRQA